MELMLLAVFAVSNIVCFVIGAKVGQTVRKGKDITLSPAKIVKEHKVQKEADKEKNKNDTILRNIDRYNGTGLGQEDVPR